MGPLEGIRVIELAGLGPAPFCAMMLSDMGAEVIRIERQSLPEAGIDMPPNVNFLNRGRRSATIDLKKQEGVDTLKRMLGSADVLIEGFRPGVMERLGLGPDELLAVNPGLVYGRITGWGQSGPSALTAGHDINYIALTGMLDAIGERQRPIPPLNLVGDFGGGALYLAFGIVCALIERGKSGEGQVIDAAMVDGVASLGTLVYSLASAGMWNDSRGDNEFDGGAPWYCTYETSDGKHVAIGAIESRFYQLLLDRLGLSDEMFKDRRKSNWESLRAAFTSVFKTRTRDEWCAVMDGADACFAPVLSLREAPQNSHLAERATFVEYGGYVQPSPAPRFSRTQGEIQRPPALPGEHTDEVLADWGIPKEVIASLRRQGVLGSLRRAE